MSMNNNLRFVLSFFMLLAVIGVYAKEDGLKGIFSVTACPAENCSNAMNFSWATDISVKNAVLEVAKVSDKDWKKSVKQRFDGVLCATYDSVYSKSVNNEDIYEHVVINKYNASIKGLKRDTPYKYRIVAGSDTAEVRYFRSGGAKEWEACIISDFHVYAPLYDRTRTAMNMISTVEKFSPFDWILHLGDITAWGGSYSFWRDLYTEQPFKKYMWAGVNGNHDNMTRGYIRTTNEFFRDAAAYPLNGYKGEEGVCYHFRYGDVLFIMLNSENMKSSAGLEAAQKWVTEVVENNPAPYIVVCEHYEWFMGKTGADSQYKRWSALFDKLDVNLALAGNNHIYVSVPSVSGGTVYIQTPSSDNERGVEYNADEPLQYNADKIKFRWSEGAMTVGAMHMKVTPKKMILTLLDRYGNVLDVNEVLPAKR